MSDEKEVEIVEVKPKRRKQAKLEESVVEVGLVEETNPEPPVLPEIFQKKIERDPLQLIEWNNSAEPLGEEVEPVPLSEPLVEQIVPPEPSMELVDGNKDAAHAGQGSWHGKHNLARQNDMPGRRKYNPVHRQR